MKKASTFPMHPAIPMANAWCRFDRLTGRTVKEDSPFVPLQPLHRSIGDTSMSSTPVERLALRLLFGLLQKHPLDLQLRTFLEIGLILSIKVFASGERTLRVEHRIK